MAAAASDQSTLADTTTSSIAPASGQSSGSDSEAIWRKLLQREIESKRAAVKRARKAKNAQLREVLVRMRQFKAAQRHYRRVTHAYQRQLGAMAWCRVPRPDVEDDTGYEGEDGEDYQAESSSN